MAAIKTLWLGWSSRFTVLQQREKLMVIGATAVAILFGGYNFWIEPGMLQAARLKKTLAQQQGEQAQLAAQLATLAAQKTDPNLANRETLKNLRDELAGTERDLKTFDGTLVAPTQAPALLQTLLARHRGLKMVSLATLPPQPLIEPSVAKEKSEKAKADEPAAMPGGNIFKHGIEIKVTGGYHDLLAYVSDLESGPQKLLWGDMSLSSPTEKYPVSELTLTVFTLSLDSTWLVV